MFSHKEGVRVRHLQEQMAPEQQKALLEELAAHSERVRLRVVLNCSAVRRLNRTTIMLLLSCLEIALMSNGDLRLAAVSPLVEAKLRQLGISEVLEFHATAEGAVKSFHERPYSAVGMADHTTPAVQDRFAA